MARRLTRRGFRRLLAVSLAGMLLSVMSRRSDADALENCYWKKVSGPTCNAYGQFVER